jgi:hypothetical protein
MKTKYFGFRVREPKSSDHSKLIAKMDIAFSEVVRLSAADHNGECVCITCGEKRHWTVMQCGHFIKRMHMATRYDLKNSGVQCSTCNCVNDGREDDHALYIDRTYGAGTAEKLRKQSLVETKFLEHELQAMLKELNKEIRNLKAEKGMI